MHSEHIAMQASSIDIMTAGVVPCIRSIVRIIVLHMSAQFMHAGAHDIICVEHTVHACSQAEQASIQACMSDMSIVLMPAIDMSLDIMSIIIESTSHSFRFAVRATTVAWSERYSSMPPASPGHGCAQDEFTRPTHVPPRRSLERMPTTPASPRLLTRFLAVALSGILLTAAGLLVASPASAHDEL